MLRSVVRLGSLVALAVAPLGAQGVIRGVVLDSLITDRPLAGAQVVLQGTPQSAVTDAAGRFVIRDVPAGSWPVTFFHPVLDSLEISAPYQTVVVEDGRQALLTLGMPSARAMMVAWCEREPEASTALVFGTVRDAEAGAALPGAVVRVTWTDFELAGVGVRQRPREQVDTAGADGSYVLCGVPNDIAVTLGGEFGTQRTGALTLALDRRGIGRRDLMVSRTDTAARGRASSGADDGPSAVAPPGGARLRIRVINAQGSPVPGAAVSIRGTDVAGTTGPDGTARLERIPSGSQTVLVRRPGVQPVTQVADLRHDADNELSVELGKVITELPSVAVMGRRPNKFEEDLQRRVTMGSGRLFTEEQIAQATTNSLGFWSMVPGVRTSRRGFDTLPLMTSGRGGPCTPVLFFNGIQLYDWAPNDLRNYLAGARRMEVYARAATVPQEYRTLTDCGVIAIWQ